MYDEKYVASITSIDELKSFLCLFLKDSDVEVFLFGSRASGKSTYTSDIDLAFLSNDDISYKLSALREILDDSNLPQKVDLIDLKNAPSLKNIVKSEGIRWI
ncbi:MAG: nucleotidyltransferase domain-containing protein [Deltaproteobacteria bacterium]|jgi:predicted nucleotidyltransferase|nr:nucleotidyltransferase domain-containing protein [Deltaproteobacteria bacterium]